MTFLFYIIYIKLLSSNYLVVHVKVLTLSDNYGYSGKSDVAIKYIEYVLFGSKLEILKF